MHLFHKWSRWSEPVDSGSPQRRYFRQRRSCSFCGKAEERWV